MKKILLSVLLVFSTSIFAESNYDKGLKAYEFLRYNEAVKQFKIASENGNKDAQFILGAMYYSGEGVKQDYKEAVRLFSLSANQGDSSAQFNLGNMYYNGESIKADKIKAYEWWLKAAKQGETNAQHNLDILCKQSPWACK